MRFSVILLALISVFIFSCSSKNSQKKHDIRELTPELLFKEQAHLIPLYDSLSQSDKLKFQTIYKDRNYACLFYLKSGELSPNGQKMIQIIQNSLYYGLPQTRIYNGAFENKDSLSKSIEIVVKDAQLTLSVLRFFDDLKNGFSDSLKIESKRKFHLADTYFLDSINQVRQTVEIDSLIQRNSPQNIKYRWFSKALKEHLDTADVTVQLYKVPLTKKDSSLSYQRALQNLKLKKIPFDSTASPKNSMIKYQRLIGVHPDGLIGEATQHVLEESPLDLAYRIAWYMEKSRYEPNYPKHFVRVNIPEFKLFYFNKDTVVSINNIVVGKLEHSSPTLTARIYGIQTFPFWNVPPKIATKEILPAIKADKHYLEKNQMVLMRGDKEIDPKTINFSKLSEKNFPYKVRQLPGEKNSLGIIKFEFYNKYDVYIHDTPQKRLLDYPNRTYSHGCIRCQNPVELAQKVLEIDENKIIPDSLDSVLGRKEQYLIRLKKQIPIYIEYNSITISPILVEKNKKKHRNSPSDEYEDKLVFCRDVYFEDEKVIRHFFAPKEWAKN